MLTGLFGVTVMEARGDGVKAVEPEIPPDVAVMVVEPALTAVARPWLPMVAIPLSAELQATEAVKSRKLLSEYLPVALNCTVVPGAILVPAGVTATETKVAGAGDEPRTR
jgi:hypothetical protein